MNRKRRNEGREKNETKEVGKGRKGNEEKGKSEIGKKKKEEKDREGERKA